MENKDNFVQGLMLGGVVGVVVGLMLAPESGQKTRRELVERFNDLQDVLSDRLTGLKKTGKDLVKTVGKTKTKQKKKKTKS